MASKAVIRFSCQVGYCSEYNCKAHTLMHTYSYMSANVQVCVCVSAFVFMASDTNMANNKRWHKEAGNEDVPGC